MALDIREDDLEGEAVRELLTLHLQGMRDGSAPGLSFALDLADLRTPGLTVWSAWRDGSLAGIAALKDLGEAAGELKSMRTHPKHLRQGVGAALLEHVIAAARRQGMRRLSLETGEGAAFEAALALYSARGFRDGEPFADYPPTPFSRFMHLNL